MSKRVIGLFKKGVCSSECVGQGFTCMLGNSCSPQEGNDLNILNFKVGVTEISHMIFFSYHRPFTIQYDEVVVFCLVPVTEHGTFSEYFTMPFILLFISGSAFQLTLEKIPFNKPVEMYVIFQRMRACICIKMIL